VDARLPLLLLEIVLVEVLVLVPVGWGWLEQVLVGSGTEKNRRKNNTKL
jgi:hypothetical protein